MIFRLWVFDNIAFNLSFIDRSIKCWIVIHISYYSHLSTLKMSLESLEIHVWGPYNWCFKSLKTWNFFIQVLSKKKDVLSRLESYTDIIYGMEHFRNVIATLGHHSLELLIVEYIVLVSILYKKLRSEIGTRFLREMACVRVFSFIFGQD